MAGAIRGRRHTKGVLCVMQERFKPLFDSAVDAFMFLDQVGSLLSSHLLSPLSRSAQAALSSPA